jgi:hypothetical protein
MERYPSLQGTDFEVRYKRGVRRGDAMRHEYLLAHEG